MYLLNSLGVQNYSCSFDNFNILTKLALFRIWGGGKISVRRIEGGQNFRAQELGGGKISMHGDSRETLTPPTHK